ncbi:LysR substrate-binding domain-containing protein [Roseococcus sp. DSY-14]|uniref:LysR substrate-binding domain-containing protein n=1 Tax=Roseococcus sp. DSY-14 TaxID=3369650 RepID=UPI00387B1726
MDLRQLQNFVRIVEAGSITRAAALVGIAQPALTLQVARLEQELGVPLLLRSPRGVKPTEAGLSLHRQARELLRQAERIPARVRASAGEAAGEVSVGLPTALVAFFAAPLMRAVAERLPRVTLRLFDGQSALLREHALTGRVDLALVSEHGPQPALDRLPLFRQRLSLLTDGTGPGDAEGAPIALEAAAARAAGLPSPGNVVRAAFDAALARAGLAAQARVELNSLPTVVAAVREGLGAAITIWTPLPAASGLCHRPVEPALSIAVSLCAAAGAAPDPAAEAVRALLAEGVRARIGAGDWPGAEPLT